MILLDCNLMMSWSGFTWWDTGELEDSRIREKEMTDCLKW